MSIINMDDLQYVQADDIDRIQQVHDVVVIHPQPHSHGQINTQDLENPYQDQTVSSPLHENSEMMPVAVLHDGRNNPNPSSKNIHDIRDYTVWSLFSFLFCGFLVGIYALNMSSTTKTKRKNGNYIGARNASKLTVLLNVAAALSGVLFFSLATLRFTGHLSM